MIIPVLIAEKVAYLGETIRLDISKSIVSADETDISEYSIKPDAAGDYIRCDEKKYVDFVFDTIGEKTISVKVQGEEKAFNAYVTVVDPDDLTLFSDDSDMIPFEPSMFNYLPDGWSKFTRAHKRAQDTILDWLDEKGIRKSDCSRYTATDVYDILEVQTWSTMLAMSYSFEGLSNQVDDIFSKKATHYQAIADTKASRASIRLKSEDDSSKPVVRTLSTSRMVRG